MKTWMSILLLGLGIHAAAGTWQQEVDYHMSVTLDDVSHQYSGNQTLVYINHSPDTLTRAFWHLFYNAFQEGSEMDYYTRNVLDPDRRLVALRNMKPEDAGFIHVEYLMLDGVEARIEESGTILEVWLPRPVAPGDTVTFTMTFTGQVPQMTRRAGRNNPEGIAYSMSQWYPKLAAYDKDGWHPDPYISREFYADFGNFDVEIAMDSAYTVAAGGVLKLTRSEGAEKTWHYRAERVHDFVWAADKQYTHKTLRRSDDVLLHFYYRPDSQYIRAWEVLPEIMDHAMDYINAHFGQYPYPEYAFIQGGDGGMEYAMATLITGNRPLRSLVGVAVHELMHNWYQMVLATNESLYAWMDEGFANYAESNTIAYLESIGDLPASAPLTDQGPTYANYYRLVQTGLEEPMSTHADHFNSNFAYGIASYTKGELFLRQLEYIIGEEAVARVMLRYFDTWKFRHPRPLDFLRIAEKESGMVLDWYYQYWILSTRSIDFAVEIQEVDGEDVVQILRKGGIPMPVEVEIEEKFGKKSVYYIPLDLMRGEKALPADNWTQLPDWQSTNKEYSFDLPCKPRRVKMIRIDPTHRLADIDPENNVFDPDDHE